MMQSGNVQTAALGLFAQLLNAGVVVEDGELDSGAPSDFIDAMGNQIRGLLEKNGVDPAALESLDSQALVAHFLAAMQGEAAAIQADADGGSAMDGLDRLLSGLDSGQAEGAQGGSETDEDACVTAVDGLDRIEALPAFVLEQLAQSGALRGDGQGSEGRLTSLPGHAGVAGQIAAEAIGRANGDLSQDADRLARSDRSALEARLGELLSGLAQTGAVSEAAARGSADGRLASSSQGLATALHHQLVSSGSASARGALVAASDLADMSDAELSEIVEALRSQLAAASTEQAAAAKLKGTGASTVQSMAQALGVEWTEAAVPDSIAALVRRGDARADAFAAFSADQAAEDSADAPSFVSGLRGSDAATGPQRALVFDLSRLLQPGGEGRLAEQVKWTLQAGLESAELKLHPPSLGTLDVRVTMEGDKASVQFVSPHPVVREVLEAALPRLREALAQDGVALADVSVSEHRAGGGDGSGGGRSGQLDEAHGGDAPVDEAGEELGTAVGALSRRLSQHDYFA